jgi:molybdopterin-guanine dinucleotide biosynthesis protein A
MGVDKAFVNFRGMTLLGIALQSARSVADSVAIVGDPGRFGEYGTALSDAFTGCGPLAGIHAALLRSTADLNLMLAVDLPFASPGLLAFLFAVAAEDPDQAIVTVPRIGTQWQPLCAVYRSEFAAVAALALRAGSYKIDATFASVAVRTVQEQELAAAGFSARNFLNLNTPEDRLAALESAQEL